jgi:AraC-like DNA-binding protein
MLDKVYNYPTHIHQYAELVIPLEGELHIKVEDNEELLSPGDASLVFPFQAHSYSSKVKNKLAIFVFSPSMLPDFFSKTERMVGERSVFTPNESTKDVFKKRIFEKGDFELFDIKGCLYLMIGDFIESVPLKKSSGINDISVSIVNYINTHITDDITLDSIASELGYNPNYLSRKIREIFGINLCNLIANIRADKAKYLLYETNKTGLEICYECGFGSERSFHRQFKSVTGKTPSDYRASFACGAINPPKTVHFK